MRSHLKPIWSHWSDGGWEINGFYLAIRVAVLCIWRLPNGVPCALWTSLCRFLQESKAVLQGAVPHRKEKKQTLNTSTLYKFRWKTTFLNLFTSLKSVTEMPFCSLGASTSSYGFWTTLRNFDRIHSLGADCTPVFCVRVCVSRRVILVKGLCLFHGCWDLSVWQTLQVVIVSSWMVT